MPHCGTCRALSNTRSASRSPRGSGTGTWSDRLHRAAGAVPTGTPGINRPGWVTRETEELQAVHWDDAPAHRGGRESRRILIVELDGEPRGYVTFRRTLGWEATGPRGQVSTGEVVATDAAAARALGARCWTST